MAVLEVRNLKYVYGAGTPFETEALNNVSVSFEKGELVSVIGHTGSGKSTLLMHMNGLLKPSSGEVLLDGKSIWESKASVRAARFFVGYCFQYPEYQLFESTVERDIAFGPKNMGLSEAQIKERVREAARFAGVRSELLSKSPFDLSGGEKRRAAIAGVMAMRPEVLILDEPTAGLDPRGRREIVGLVREYNRQTGKTVIFVSHNMDDVASVADRVLVMSEGSAVLYDTVKEVFKESERLLSMGLDVPEVTRLLLKLKRKGVFVPTDIFSADDAKNALLRVLKEARDD